MEALKTPAVVRASEFGDLTFQILNKEDVTAKEN